MKQWLDEVVMQGGGRLGCSALPGNTLRVLESVVLWTHALLLTSQHSSAQKLGSCLHSSTSMSCDCAALLPMLCLCVQPGRQCLLVSLLW